VARISSLVIALATALALPASAGEVLRYEILPGATLEIPMELPRVLEGFLDIECRDPVRPDCFQVGEVVYDATALELRAEDLVLAASGPFDDAPGFSVERALTLQDVGVLMSPPQDRAGSLFYGFDPELVMAGPDFDRYRVWILDTPPEGGSHWTGAFTPPLGMELELSLTETFFDVGSTSISSSTGTVASISMSLPEPVAGLSTVAAALALSALRRRRGL
jgi:hypothetical protein